MTAPWMAFIESNTSGTGRLFARAAAAQGFRPILLSADPSRYPYVAEDGISVVTIDTQDEPALLDRCRRLADAGGLAGVCSSSEYFIATAAGLAAQMGLSGPRRAAIEDCRDKYVQRQRLAEAGVGGPAFRAAERVEEAVAAAEALGYPVVVKPTGGSGSVGVRLCGDAGDVRAHAAALLQQGRNERGLPTAQRILVEDLAIGPEFSVEVFDGAVIGITQKYVSPPPYFIEVGHDFPATLPPATEQAIHQTVQRSLDALGLRWGAIHVELRTTAAGPWIIEVNPRLAGGFIPELVRLACGVDLIAATIQRVSGQAPRLERTQRAYAAIRFLLLEQNGTLEQIDGLDEAARVPGVVAATRYPRASDRVALQGDFRDRAGHVLACADTPEAARAAADAGHAAIRLIVRPD